MIVEYAFLLNTQATETIQLAVPRFHLDWNLLSSKLQEQAWETAPVDRALSFPSQAAWQEGQLPLSQITKGCVTLGELLKIFLLVYVITCCICVST